MSVPSCELLRLNEVERIVGLTRSQIYAFVKERTFPLPAKIGAASRWSRIEVNRWVAERLAERGQAAA